MVKPAAKVAGTAGTVQVLVQAAGLALAAPRAAQVAVQMAGLQVGLQVGRRVVESRVPTTARPSGSKERTWILQTATVAPNEKVAAVA